MEKNFKLSSSEPEEYVVAKEVQGIVPAPVRADAKTELEQVNVLYSFLENRYTRKVRKNQNLFATACSDLA